MQFKPSFYDPATVGNRYTPNLQLAMTEGLTAGLTPASKDTTKRLLLGVDPQIDFCLADGALSVAGAVDDMRRAIEYIYTHADKISGVLVSLDQHILYQIFNVTWWSDEDGNAPPPMTLISADDVNKGKWRPLLDRQWSVDYVNKLGAIMIWPLHCMIGTDGAAIVPALYEAITWLCAARHIQPMFMFKGTVPQTEHYGPWAPCVDYPSHPQGTLNTQMLDIFTKFDVIDVFGEAEDFCVREGMKQILTYFEGRPEMIERIRFLRDCTSLVFADNRAEADSILEDMGKKGVHIVKSTDPLAA